MPRAVGSFLSLRVRPRLAIVIGVVAAGLAVGAYIAARLALAQLGDSQEAGFLLATDRPDLSICVQGAGGFEHSAEDVQTVSQALESGMEGLSNVPPEYGEREVVSGCPSPAADLGKPLSKWDVRGPNVDMPSQHRVFVYLVHPAAYAATFASEPYITPGEEYQCSGDECFPVTTGLYVSASVSSEVLAEGLLRTLGLLPPKGPTLPIDWEACERGESPHPDLDCSGYEEWKRQQEELP